MMAQGVECHIRAKPLEVFNHHSAFWNQMEPRTLSVSHEAAACVLQM